MKLYKVGGCIRDELLGLKSKDIDFSVELDDKSLSIEDGFAAMREHLVKDGFKIFVESPEYVTIRAKFPLGSPEEGTDADFVLCRKEGPYTDGRRPDWVAIGSLEDDLQRRDLTVNAMAKPLGSDEVIDLFGGKQDLEDRLIRFVGDPRQRITEDALRVMRAFRFCITKGFRLEAETKKAIRSTLSANLLKDISEERRAEELDKMFKTDTLRTLDLLATLPRPLVEAMFAGRVRLTPTLKR